MSEHAIGAAQIPHGEGINLDHVAHWLPDLEAGHRALTGLGFITTPYSEQSNRPNPDAPAVPAGAANRCVMLQEGYLEFLTPIGDTDISRELRAGIERYVGLHLMAFGAADAEARHRRFESEGRPLRPLVRLSREIERETGERSTARFSVSRTAPGTMAEGRVQTLTHHTPELLWQPRYVEHPNGITGLRALFVVVSDLAEATARYRDYLRCDPQASGPLQRFPLDRGAIVLLASEGAAEVFGVEPPSVPYMLGVSLKSADLATTTRHFRAGGAIRFEHPSRELWRWPDAIGGFCELVTS